MAARCSPFASSSIFATRVTSTYKLWKEQFNSDPKILGKTFDLDGKLWTLVGIMPPRFRAGWSDIFSAFPLDRTAVAQDPTLAHMEVWPLGFLKPGVTIGQAAADLNIVAHNLAEVYPDRYPKQFRVSARSFRTRVIGMFEPIIDPLFGAVGLLLLISCTNVANSSFLAPQYATAKSLFAPRSARRAGACYANFLSKASCWPPRAASSAAFSPGSASRNSFLSFPTTMSRGNRSQS